MKKFIACIIGIAVIAAVIVGINEYNNNRIAVTRYTVEAENVPEVFDGYKIMLLADLHDAPFENDIINIAQKDEIDIIVLCGDMVQLPNDRLLSVKRIAEGIDEKITIYAVSGNHETQNYSYYNIMHELSEYGVNVIDDKWEYIEKDGERIIIAGVMDVGTNYVMSNQYEKAEKMIRHYFDDKEEFKILVNHRADMYPEIKGWGADLILSGHLHGGVIRLPFLGGVIGKNGELFPEYDYGVYADNVEATMIVSGGCDLNPSKRRVFNPPEAVIITLKSEQKK